MEVSGDYWRDGAVCVRRAFSTTTFVGWPRRRSRPTSPISRRWRSGPARRATERSSRTSAPGSASRPMERFIRTSPAAAIAGGLLGSQSPALSRPRARQGARHPSAHAVAPGPAVLQRRGSPERQHVVPGRPDQPRRPRSSSSPVRISARGTCHARFSTARRKWFPDGSLAELPGDRRPIPTGSRSIGWALEPGDAVFFNMLTLHAAGGVDGPNRRRVLSVRFLGDDMVHAPRRWTTSPPFPGWRTSSPPARRSTIRCSRCCGTQARDRPRDPHRRPSGAPRAGDAVHRRGARRSPRSRR